jgi:hypothetical protein
LSNLHVPRNDCATIGQFFNQYPNHCVHDRLCNACGIRHWRLRKQQNKVGPTPTTPPNVSAVNHQEEAKVASCSAAALAVANVDPPPAKRGSIQFMLN